MLRTLLILLAVLVLLAIVLVATGIVNLTAQDGRVAVETRDVEVGTTTRNMELPVLRTEERQVELPSVGVRQDEPEAQPEPQANAQ